MTLFDNIAQKTKGVFYPDFKLYLYETTTQIDLLLFLPHRGLYAGERISWRADELKGATVERAVPGEKKKSATRFNAVESAIHQKLENVLSFDSTPCERFVWMEYLSEEEFDLLDPSFHTLLPKSRLVFAGEAEASILQKLENLSPYRQEPYSAVKVIGSLNAHTMLLPTPSNPFGSFLSDEQYRFLDTGFSDSVTTLYGASGSGKSTLILRKAVQWVLSNPKQKVLIITPTLLAGELLRNKLVSLMEYGAFTVPFESISFYTPQSTEPLEDTDLLREASAIFCDDAYRLDSGMVKMLKNRRGKRWLLLSTIFRPENEENVFCLENRYREAKLLTTLKATRNDVMFVLMMELRKRLEETPPNDIMVVLPEQKMLAEFKRSIDEYFGLDCRTLIPGFSLQYQNLDDLILATADYICGLRIPHLFLIAPEKEEDYPFELSRASETATIITYPNADGVHNGEDRQD